MVCNENKLIIATHDVDDSHKYKVEWKKLESEYCLIPFIWGLKWSKIHLQCYKAGERPL